MTRRAPATLLLALLLAAGCASQQRVRRRHFLFSASATGGALTYTSSCADHCTTAPGNGLSAQFGHVLDPDGKVAAFATINGGVAFFDAGKVGHALVGLGAIVWPARRLFFGGAFGIGESDAGTVNPDDHNDGLAGQLFGGVSVATWKTTTLDVWLGSTIGSYPEGRAFDLQLGLGFSTFFEFSPDKQPQPGPQTP